MQVTGQELSYISRLLLSINRVITKLIMKDTESIVKFC